MLDAAGSPPHMRGKDTKTHPDGYYRRITPAHAGKSVKGATLCGSNKDHPRTCGEKFPPRLPMFHSLGSPPHMRGKAFRVGHAGRRAGITPAHAGKSSVRPVQGFTDRDHPRTCGEKITAAIAFAALLGSPPHMRGKVHHFPSNIGARRITPAHAGKSPKA